MSKRYGSDPAQDLSVLDPQTNESNDALARKRRRIVDTIPNEDGANQQKELLHEDLLSRRQSTRLRGQTQSTEDSLFKMFNTDSSKTKRRTKGMDSLVAIGTPPFKSELAKNLRSSNSLTTHATASSSLSQAVAIAKPNSLNGSQRRKPYGSSPKNAQDIKPKTHNIHTDRERVGKQDPRLRSDAPRKGTNLSNLNYSSQAGECSDHFVGGGQDSVSGQPHQWVKLSHIGLLSDYHGLQRKHESAFHPLKFERSLSDARAAVQKVVLASNDEADTEDQEVMEENVVFEKSRRRAERKRLAVERKRHDVQNLKRPPSGAVLRLGNAGGDFLSRPLVFGVPKDGLTECESGHSCNICSNRNEALQSGSATTPSIGAFRQIDEDDIMEYLADDQDLSPCRKSRTVQLQSQKHLSTMMLREMNSTLAFIASYNQGLLGSETQVDFPTVPPVPPVGRTAAAPETNPVPAPKAAGKSVSLTAGGKPYCNSLETTFAPVWQPLSHSDLVVQYQILRRDVPFLPTFSKKVDPSMMARTLEAVVLEHGGEICTDSEIVQEEKALVRAVRSYRGKADQELIEKKEHEELGFLQVRGSQYVGRTKKRSPMEIDAAKFLIQPLRFGDLPHISHSKDQLCGFEHCTICGLPETEKNDPGGIKPRVLFNPDYKMVKLEDVEESDRDEPSKGRPSRVADLNAKKWSVVRDVKEIYHSILFVEKYNNGFGIATPGNTNSWGWFYNNTK